MKRTCAGRAPTDCERVLRDIGRADLYALPHARIELLDWLKKNGAFNTMPIRDDLRAARTLRELADRAQSVVLALQDRKEWHAAASFWEAAKDILVRWQDSPLPE